MARNKLRKFQENLSNPLVFEPGKPEYETIKGRWKADFFGNTDPLSLELACGYGEYTVGLSGVYPQTNFVGVDIKGDRIWRGATLAQEAGRQNVGFLRTLIHHLDRFFAPAEVDDIWIIFPDPRPRQNDAKRRLTHPRFLALYRSVLHPDGWIRLKTDNRQLYEYTLEVLQDQPIRDLQHTDQLYSSPLAEEHHGISTRYERKFTGLGHSIHYIKFRFRT